MLLLLGAVSEFVEFVIFCFIVTSIAGCVLLVLARFVLRRPPVAAPSAVFWIVVELATLVVSASFIWSFHGSLSSGIE